MLITIFGPISGAHFNPAVTLYASLGRDFGLFTAAGIMIGPWGLRLINDTHGMQEIAEFGVVLLLFVIGLELQPSRLPTVPQPFRPLSVTIR